MEKISNKEFEKLDNTALTIGKFDGLHKGHQMLIDRLNSLKEKGLSSVVFTFKTAPRKVLGMEEAECILTSYEKELFLENRNVDYYIEYPCDTSVLSMSAEEFVKDIVVDKIGAKYIVCGDDFHFGKDRVGDVSLLHRLGKEYGFEVIILEKLKYDKKDISSSRIRESVRVGEIELANELLGYTYTIIGKVVSGMKLGRKLGFPTANINPENTKLLPPNGVYYTKACIDGNEYKGVTNIGKKPTVNNDETINVETCFLDFSGDLYGKSVEIEFFKFVRPEKKFSSVEDLKAQIEEDVKGCREYNFGG